MKYLKVITLIYSVIILFIYGCTLNSNNKEENNKMKFEITKTEEEWKKILTPDQFYVLRQKGTEPAFTGKYYNNKKKGLYKCAGCGNPLFHSDAKFDSGSGWPSFWEPVSENSVKKQYDYSHSMIRVEVLCSKCGGHLGHVFEDGPPPTGLRYCINSTSLNFEEGKENQYKEPL